MQTILTYCSLSNQTFWIRPKAKRKDKQKVLSNLLEKYKIGQQVGERARRLNSDDGSMANGHEK